ncbi:hypothetical protein ACPV5U_19595 [Vibrio mediterranei]
MSTFQSLLSEQFLLAKMDIAGRVQASTLHDNVTSAIALFKTKKIGHFKIVGNYKPSSQDPLKAGFATVGVHQLVLENILGESGHFVITAPFIAATQHSTTTPTFCSSYSTNALMAEQPRLALPLIDIRYFDPAHPDNKNGFEDDNAAIAKQVIEQTLVSDVFKSFCKTYDVNVVIVDSESAPKLDYSMGSFENLTILHKRKPSPDLIHDHINELVGGKLIANSTFQLNSRLQTAVPTGSKSNLMYLSQDMESALLYRKTERYPTYLKNLMPDRVNWDTLSLWIAAHINWADYKKDHEKSYELAMFSRELVEEHILSAINEINDIIFDSF